MKNNVDDYSVQEIGESLIRQNNILDTATMLQNLLDDNVLTGMFLNNLFCYFKTIWEDAISNCNSLRNYVILDGAVANAIFLYTIWPQMKNQHESLLHLQHEVNQINKFYVSDSGDRLSSDEIDCLMQHVCERFQYINDLLTDMPLPICLLDCRHKESSGLYSGTRKSDGSIEDLLVLPYENTNPNFTQKFVLLHELGHFVHFRITRDLHQLPKSFYQLLDLVKAGRPNPTREMFADFFAVAALYQSPIEKDIMPFNIKAEVKEVILQYFLSLGNKCNHAEHTAYDPIHPLDDMLDELNHQPTQERPLSPVSTKKKISAFRRKLNQKYKSFPDALDIPHACEILGIGRKKLYSLVAEKKIYSVRVGRKILMPKICVLDYLEETKEK